jgi:hypothetical protein
MAISLLLVLGACARIEVNPVAAWADSDGGFRYYMPEPYLQVTAAQQSSVRIDFSKGKVIFLPSGQPNNLELGKVLGLSDASAITLTLSDESHVALAPAGEGIPANDPERSRKTTVVPVQGMVRVPVKFVKAVDAGKEHVFQIQARFGNHDLGTGVYSAKTSANGLDVASSGSPDLKAAGYEWRIVYLPNPKRILAVEHGQGIGGTAEVALQLKDGWMLTQVNSKSDTQSDENITAVASLVEAVGSAGKSLMALSTVGDKPAPPGEPKVDLTGLYRPVYARDGAIKRWVRVPLCVGTCTEEGEETHPSTDGGSGQ